MATKPKINPHYLKNFHLIATIIWLLLVPPSILWWKDSIPWLVFMSAWANLAAHFSAWQGARSETNGNTNTNATNTHKETEK